MNRQPANDHPTDEWLLTWHESPADLPAPLAREIGAHVPGCPACGARLRVKYGRDQPMDTGEHPHP